MRRTEKKLKHGRLVGGRSGWWLIYHFDRWLQTHHETKEEAMAEYESAVRRYFPDESPRQ
jgi:hypothetical protein